MARLLWLSGQYLLPADSGLYRYSLDMTNALEELGHEIRFIGRRREEGQPADQPTNWKLLPYRNPPMVQRVLGVKPAKVIEVWDKEYERAVDEAVRQFNPDVVLFDHLRVGSALDVIDGQVPCIYVSQNDETLVKRKMVRAATGIRKLALWADLYKIKRFEDRLLRECVTTSAISAADIASFAERNPSAHQVHTLPVYRGTRLPNREITGAVPRRIGLITTLYWGAKIDNIVLALEGLAPLVDEGVEVVVFTGGYMPPNEIREAHPKVTFAGFVEDFDEALAECRIGLVFEPVGGGFKMKTLDFIYHRVPLAVGKGSAESLPLTAGEDLIEVSTHRDLAPVLGSLIDDLDELNRLQNSAMASCADSFGTETVRPLSDAIESASATARELRG